VALFVPDLERSLSFYREVMGFDIERSEKGFAELTSDGVALSLWELADAEASIGLVKQPQSGYRVLIAIHLETAAEVDEMAGALAERGVRFVAGPKTFPWNAHAAYFEDPDGNLWQLYTWMAEAASDPAS
jgi:catechol 2,3-dioxygenase-like lactoylglutathione lyase family enzyme